MLLRSGRVTTLPDGPSRRGGSVEVAPARRVGHVKRKAAADADDPSSPTMATATRRVKITSRPSPPEPLSSAQAQHGGAAPPKVPEASDDDKALAELAIKLFPHLPSEQATALWVGFVNDAKTCIKHYNLSHKTNFAYKHESSNGFYLVEELGGEMYYHMNFLGQDEDGNSQRFFGEIRIRVSPRVEDVTCCCPVTFSNAAGKGIRTIEEAIKYEQYAQDFDTVGYDPEHCYCCTSRVKHPKGTSYVAGHFADARAYYDLSDIE